MKKLVLTYYYTGIKDRWHKKTTQKCDPRDFDVLFKSVKGRGYDFITLSNELRTDDWTTVDLTGDLARPDDMSLYLHKFIACYEWLKKHPEYDEIWIVDSSDTEMLATPQPENGIIYTGYDAFFPAFNQFATFLWFLGGPFEGIWIPAGFGRGVRHGDDEIRYLRDCHLNDKAYNCGVFGGKREIVMDFLEKFTDRLRKNDIDLEMVAFNYLIYTQYQNKTKSITTRMTLGEHDMTKWWRHK